MYALKVHFRNATAGRNQTKPANSFRRSSLVFRARGAVKCGAMPLVERLEHMSDTPMGLTGSGLALWERVTSSYKLRFDEAQVLEDACRTRCLIDRLEDNVASAGLYTTGSMGQEVINPLFTELRQQRAAFAKFVAQLKLPDLAADGSTAPAKDAGAEAGRLLAAKRWGTA